MIYGIIQEVCGKIISDEDLEYDIRNTAYQIEKQLIEEIIILVNNNRKAGYTEPEFIEDRFLIGDNK